MKAEEFYNSLENKKVFTKLTDTGIGSNLGNVFEFADNFNTELLERRGKLQAFKDYVHQRLDDAGIEKEPNREHSEHGCRIGDRLDIVLEQRDEAVKALKSLQLSMMAHPDYVMHDSGEFRDMVETSEQAINKTKTS